MSLDEGLTKLLVSDIARGSVGALVHEPAKLVEEVE